MDAYFVIGLGFGDEGKGTIVDSIVEKTGASLIVRFNGGAQAAHHVVRADGTSHCFSQFGSTSSTIRPWTYLSRFMTWEPAALHREAEALSAATGQPEWKVIIDGEAPIVTPYHWAMNQLREIARGAGRHGSCGLGIGEVSRDIANDAEVIYAKDLRIGGDRLRQKAASVQARLTAEAEAAGFRKFAHPAWRLMETRSDDWALLTRWVATKVKIGVPDGHYPTVVFEGAQGVLLDEWHGFHPYTTWSTTTFENAYSVLREFGESKPARAIGVIRSYMTRHGAGPFPTEGVQFSRQSDVLFGEHNKENAWQQRFRSGALDAMLLNYACGVSQPTEIALTHMDKVVGEWPIVVSYANPDDVYEIKFGRDLKHAEKNMRVAVNARPFDDVRLADVDAVKSTIEQLTNVPVTVQSFGPTAADKRFTW